MISERSFPIYKCEKGATTYTYLLDRVGNNLRSINTFLEAGLPNEQEMQQSKTAFLETLKYAITSHAPEGKGITREKLQAIIGLAEKSDWTKKEDIKILLNACNDLLK
jgi:hypothetical protein